MATVEQLERRFRVDVDDRNGPDYLWTPEWFLEALNEAQDEACIRARLLTDAITTAICTIDVDDTLTEYQLDPRVIDVDKIVLGTSRRFLGKRDRLPADDLRALQGNHELSAGTPCYFAVEGMPAGGLVLLLNRPAAVASYTTLQLTVNRLPLVRLLTGSDTPEIAETLHTRLLHWVEHLAYRTRDADAGSAPRSDAAEERFNRCFGTRPSARWERTRLGHRVKTIRSVETDLLSLPRKRYNPRADD